MREVFTPYITLKSGRRIYASSYGLKAFHFFVDDESEAGQKPEPEPEYEQ